MGEAHEQSDHFVTSHPVRQRRLHEVFFHLTFSQNSVSILCIHSYVDNVYVWPARVMHVTVYVSGALTIVFVNKRNKTSSLALF